MSDATKRGNRPPNTGPWHQIHFRVNLFTQDEWPYQETASLDDCSLGEEQSTSIVTALAWSAPGLALHGRCVLAVSTSNHLVSLWEPQHKPTESSDWYRSCILNHALQLHVLSSGGEEAQARRRTRIRAVTWSREPPKLTNSWKALPFLAVVNPDGDLYLLRLNSDKRRKSYEATVLLQLPAADQLLVKERPRKTLVEKQPGEGQRHASISRKRSAKERTRRQRAYPGYSVAWSDWHHNGLILQSVLVYKHAGFETYHQIACSPPDITSQANGTCYGRLTLSQGGEASVRRSAADGPSIWLPKVNVLGMLLLRMLTQPNARATGHFTTASVAGVKLLV